MGTDGERTLTLEQILRNTSAQRVVDSNLFCSVLLERVFVNGGVFGRERSLVPSRFATSTRLLVLEPQSLLEVILVTVRKNKMFLVLSQVLGELQISKSERQVLKQ